MPKNGHGSKDVAKAFVLVAPPGAGVRTVARGLFSLGIAELCVLDTTLEIRPGMNGDRRSVDRHQFLRRLTSGKYILVHGPGSYLSGIAIDEVARVWDTGRIPLLRGMSGHADDAERALNAWIVKERGDGWRVDVSEIRLVTDPPDAWQNVIRRTCPHPEEAIFNGQRELDRTQTVSRSSIGHIVVNEWGSTGKAVDAIAQIIGPVKRLDAH